MRCPLCGQENAGTNSFCIYCGAELHNVEDEADTLEIGPDAPEPERVIGDLTGDVRQLQMELRQVLSILSSQHDTVATRQPLSPDPTVAMRLTSDAPASESSLWNRVDLSLIHI